MTQTTNIGLKKIDGSENWRQIFDYYNDSADKTDSAVAAVQDGFAIVANGNTHAAVAEGQFVYVRNHSTLAEGLYKASSVIQTNGGLTTSNLTAVGSGGLNDLQEQVTSLNSKLTPIEGELTDIITPSRRDTAKYSVSGNVCTIFINNVSFGASYSSDTEVFTCPYKPIHPTRFVMYDGSRNIIPCWVNANTGNVIINNYTSGKLIYGSVSFVCGRN